MKARETGRQAPEDQDYPDVSELRACSSRSSPHPIKSWCPPTPTTKGANGTGALPHRCPPSQEAGELPAPSCGRTHSTTSRRAQEPWEEVVTYCSATKQSEVTTQHRLSSPGLVMEETDDTSFPPFPLPRDCSRGHKVVLSGQKPGAMTRVATAQEARSTEWGR